MCSVRLLKQCKLLLLHCSRFRFSLSPTILSLAKLVIVIVGTRYSYVVRSHWYQQKSLNEFEQKFINSWFEASSMNGLPLWWLQQERRPLVDSSMFCMSTLSGSIHNVMHSSTITRNMHAHLCLVPVADYARVVRHVCCRSSLVFAAMAPPHRRLQPPSLSINYIYLSQAYQTV